MKPQSLFSPALPPTEGANAIGQSATTANSFCDLCLQLMSAWFTLLFKALRSESGSVKFVAQVFCLPRLSSDRELANTFVGPACACVCATCLALATCHLARLRHRTSMPVSTLCACVRVCLCVCSRANCEQVLFSVFARDEDVTCRQSRLLSFVVATSSERRVGSLSVAAT